MKKLLVGIVILLLLFFSCVYLLIPSQIHIKAETVAKVSPAAATRILSSPTEWNKWWPEKKANNKPDSLFHYSRITFAIDKALYAGFDIDIVNGSDSIHSLFNLLPLHSDSVQLQWNGLLDASANPIKRVKQYFNANETKRDMYTLLSELKSFLEKQENVYGMAIRREIVKDTLLVMKERIITEPPTTRCIYEVINTLKTHIKNAGASETNYPMVNANETEAGVYRLMVAIPIDHEIQVTDSIVFRKMVPGWILVADVKGGPARIRTAFIEMSNFINDYSKSPVALPFESIVTDRQAEPDTSKWMTRIYFPVVL